MPKVARAVGDGVVAGVAAQACPSSQGRLAAAGVGTGAFHGKQVVALLMVVVDPRLTTISAGCRGACCAPSAGSTTSCAASVAAGLRKN